MREIKFRVYNTREKKFEYDYKNNCCMWDTLKYDYKESLWQFTWLKDKNWKEIYDGDIVCEKESVAYDWECFNNDRYDKYIDIRKEENFEYMWGTRWTRRYWKKIFIVERDNASCWFEPFSDSRRNCLHCWWWMSSKDIEIIWNIYNNQELLKSKK